MGSFNSRAASKQHPMPVHLSNQNVKTNGQRKDGESFTNLKTRDRDEYEVSQNVEEEDPCMTKRRNSNTSTTKRPTTLHGASYLWLVSSPITQDEGNLVKESAAKCRSSRSSISTSGTDRLQSSKHESIKTTRSRPQLCTYPPPVSTYTKTQSPDSEKPSSAAGFVPFSPAKTARRSKSTSKSNVPAKILTRPVGFGVDKPYSHPVQR